MTYAEKLSRMKEKSGMTSHQIAEKSGIPSATVSRIFSGQTEDPNFSNVVSIVKAMGGSVDELVGIEPKTVTIVETKTVEADARLIALYETTVRDKNRWITVLFVLLSVLLFGIIALLLYDFTSPESGWYTQEELSRVHDKVSLAISGFRSWL